MDWRIYLYKYIKHIYDMRQYNINKINTYKKVTSTRQKNLTHAHITLATNRGLHPSRQIPNFYSQVGIPYPHALTL